MIMAENCVQSTLMFKNIDNNEILRKILLYLENKNNESLFIYLWKYRLLPESTFNFQLSILFTSCTQLHKNKEKKRSVQRWTPTSLTLPRFFKLWPFDIVHDFVVNTEHYVIVYSMPRKTSKLNINGTSSLFNPL